MHMNRVMAGVVVSLALAGGASSAAWASANPNGNPNGTQQPNQSCQSEPSSPGNASSASGAAFNEDPGGVAGAMYAGSQPQNSNNSKSVSQYDVACYEVSTTH